MLEIVLIGLGAAAAAFGGGVWLGFARKGRSHRRWQAALTEAAARLPGARASPGTRLDGPELRVDLEGHTVSLRIRGEGDRGEARATVALGPAAPSARLWLGWDVDQVPPDWQHLPEVRVSAARAEGTVLARSDDAAFAARAWDGAYLDLVDVRREARAHGVVLSTRGGYLDLRFLGIETSPHLLERLVRAAARIAAALPSWAHGSTLGPGEPA